jgi:DNA-directed RNA polymerase subunit RPC12/RpoP
MTLREFECKHCGHVVVVNPNLPADYTPTVCTSCWEAFEKPKVDRITREVELISRRLCDLLGQPVGPPLSGQEIAEVEEIIRRKNENFSTGVCKRVGDGG